MRETCGRQKWKEMEANLWQNDPAKPSSKSTIEGRNEKTWKPASGKMIRPSHPKAIMWETKKEIKANLWQNDPAKQMIRPRHPAKQSSGRQMTRNKSKPLAKCSSQAIQRSNHVGDKWKEMKANLWQKDPAKPSSKAIMWETCGRQMKRNGSKPLQNDPAKTSSKAIMR